MRRYSITFGLVILLLFTAGCFPIGKGPETTIPGQPPISPTPQTGEVVVNLYFADDQAMNLWPEVRLIKPGNDSLAQAVIGELIKGPGDPTLKPTFPKEARVLSVQTRDGVTYVNFNKETQTRHSGGSAGEAMTLGSLVLTLTELPGVQRVQVLVEGQKQDTLAGHWDITQPLEREIRLGEVYVSEERHKYLQQQVDKGQDQWRLDPLEVAKREGGVVGFLPSDTYELRLPTTHQGLPVRPKGDGYGEATVLVQREKREFLMSLRQPAGPSPNHIWMITGVIKQ